MRKLYKDLQFQKETDETPFSILSNGEHTTSIFISPDLNTKPDPNKFGFAWNIPKENKPDGAIENTQSNTHLRIQVITEMVPGNGLFRKLRKIPSLKLITEAGVGIALPNSVGLDKVAGANEVYLYIGTVEELILEVMDQ